MELTDVQKKIRDRADAVLEHEAVASPDHVARMTRWCEAIGRPLGCDMETLVAGALVHDIGVPTNRKFHFVAGREVAAPILREAGLPEEKIPPALHVLESHSRYGGAPKPETLEAKVGQDSDALEYIGAIGIVRAVVRGMKDGSFSGRAEDFPKHLRDLLGKVEGSFHTEAGERFGRARIEYMKRFLADFEKELSFDA